MIKVKRIYEKAQPGDGFRVLVDRLWPRGLSREAAHLDLWLKEIAPSDGLRKWYGHDPEKWPEFKRRYVAELQGKLEIVRQLSAEASKKTLTLLYSSKNTTINNAVALKDFIESKIS